MTEYECDVAVCGGGIAGLWAMHALRARGFRPVLLERHTLGGRQTLAAQGILHGGLKYALDGKVDDISLRLREMPPLWLDCMAGKGEVDLSGTQVLSDCQHLWSDGSLLSKLSGAVGSKMMSGDVDSLDRKEWPEAFRQLDYRGSVRVLRETVIDVKSALQCLSAPMRDALYQADEMRVITDGERISALELQTAGQPTTRLKARIYLFTAGTGNEIPAGLLPIAQPATQRRPLRQMLIKNAPCKLYGHCIIADPKPRVTITTHTLQDGSLVWYMGGNIAEKACKLPSEEASIRFAIDELQAIFPKFNWNNYQWGIWDIDRAEPHQSVRFMPSEPTVTHIGNSLIAWPTKLVFAPGLAARIATEVTHTVQPTNTQGPPQLALPQAQIGRYPWEQVTWRTAGSA